MAQLRYSFFSEVLQTKKNMIIIGDLTQKVDNVFFFFHGVGGNEEDFLINTKINKIAERQKIVCILVDIDRSFLSNTKGGYDYLKYVDEEIYEIIDSTFAFDLRNSKKNIIGFSMGGYAALRLFLSNINRYDGVGSIAGSVDIVSRDKEKREIDNFIKKEWEMMFGETLSNEYDLFEKIRKVNIENKKIYLSVGKDDFLYKYNLKFHEHLLKNDIKHIFDVEKGKHDYDYVDQQLEKIIVKLKESNDKDK